MPSYMFISDDGEVMEKIRPMTKDVPGDFTLHGKRFRRDFQAEQCRQSGDPWTDGIWSTSAGVSPRQVKEANADLKKHRIDAKYGKDGRLFIPNRQTRNRVLEHLGMHDKDAGYGDRAPGNREER